MPIKIFTGTPEVRERLVKEFIDKMQLYAQLDEMFEYTVASNNEEGLVLSYKYDWIGGLTD